MFYKRRDLSVVIDGKNPIIAHEYLGKDVKDKDIIVIDDMIDSGGSMLEVVEELNKRGARKVFLFSTFALFSKGVDKFNEYYKKGIRLGDIDCIKKVASMYQAGIGCEKNEEKAFEYYFK